MLPVCLVKRPNFGSFCWNSDKRYRVIARLGQRTDTLRRGW
ncbi:hypothetical protein ACNKHW_20140 [Shigella flexneri]